MYKSSSYFFFIYLLLAIFLLSCKSQPKNIKSAALTYDITFPEIDKEKKPITSMLLPKKQKFLFKDSRFLTHIKKATFELKILSETTEPTFYSEFYFNNIQHTHLKGEQLNTLKASLPEYEVNLTDERDTLKGLSIKKAIVKYEDFGTIDVWYTEDFTIQDPNWCTPYKEIPGVLIDYVIYQFGVRMNLKLAAWEEKEISDSLLTINPKGSELTFDAFQKEMGGLFKNLLD